MRQLLKDTAIYGLGDFAFKAVAFAIFPIYTHLFTVEQFGILTLVTTLMGFLSLLLTLGINNAISRYYYEPDYLERRPQLVTTGLVAMLGWAVAVTVVALALLYPASGLIAARYHVPWLLIVLGLLINLPSLVVDYALGVLRLRFQPWHFTALSALRNLAGVFTGLVLIAGLHQGLEGYFWGLLGAVILLTPVALWLIRADLCLHLDRTAGMDLVLFGYPFLFAGLAYWATGSLDRWMLGDLSTVQEVGLYGIAYKFAGLMIFINSAFGQAWSPYAMKVRTEDPHYRETFGLVLSHWYLVACLMGVGLTLFAHELLRMTTPASYWGAANSIGVLAMGVVLLGTTQVTALGISLERRSGLLSLGAWLTAIANFGLNLLLIPRFGSVGAGLATLLSYSLMTAFYLFWTQRLHPIPLKPGRLAFTTALVVAVPAFAVYCNALPWDARLVALKLGVFGIVFILGAMVHNIGMKDARSLLQRKLP